MAKFTLLNQVTENTNSADVTASGNSIITVRGAKSSSKIKVGIFLNQEQAGVIDEAPWVKAIPLAKETLVRVELKGVDGETITVDLNDSI